MRERGRHSYVLCDGRLDVFKNRIDVGLEDITLQYGDACVLRRRQSGKSLILIGDFVDCEDPSREQGEIADELFDLNDLDSLLRNTKKLAGRFIIIFVSGARLFVLPDATASIPVNYAICGNPCVSSTPGIIADIHGWSESDTSREVRSSADLTQALPYDMTMYDQIKKVPPNHFLEFQSRTATRFYPLERSDPVSVEMAAEMSSKALRNIIAGYHKRLRLALPLTAGLDSRTILAVCKEIMSDVPTYTFFHHDFSDAEPDIDIPRRMAAELGFRHYVLRHSAVPERVLEHYRNALGSAVVPSEMQNAWTYHNSELADRATLQGNVSPLGKSNFGRALPERFASPSYLLTKTHNHSRANQKEVARWVGDVECYSRKSGVSKFDLFYWEHREGNWAAAAIMNADLLTDSIAPSNCRQLIETWLRVPRRERMGGQIHKRIIQLNWPEVLDWPINPGSEYAWLYRNSLLFYIGVRGKFFLEGFRRRTDVL